MKKIVLMPVKNEDWILEYSLSCASLWADFIIVADQDSTDNTREICKKFQKVICIKNDSPFHSGGVRRLLLEEARKIPWNNLLFSLDADEVISSNLLDAWVIDKLTESIAPGDCVLLQWVNLWGDVNSYRNDNSVWSHSWKHFVFYDNREYDYDFVHLINDHSSRVPWKSIQQKEVKNEDIKVIHFQFLWKERMLSKQRRYRVHDLIQQKNNFYNNLKLNYKYFPTKIDEKVYPDPIDQYWLLEYKNNGISTDQIQFITNTYWYDEYVLEKFQEFWVHYFKYLDIWDTDWGKKASSLGMQLTIKDPRNPFIKTYHYFQFLIPMIVSLIPSSIKTKL